MKYALFSVPVGTIYDLPQTIKEGEAGLVSTIGDEGLYGQACQVRTAPGGVTTAGVQLPPDVAEVVSFYGYHGYVNQRELQFVREEELWEYLGEDLVLVGRATDVLSLPKVQGVRMWNWSGEAFSAASLRPPKRPRPTRAGRRSC